MRDAYNLRLENCGLAVLSACETGISKIAKGEELLGLIRGFLSAGAPCLVLSLWKVEDESTAELMKLFYESLKKNLSVSAALMLREALGNKNSRQKVLLPSVKFLLKCTKGENL